MGEPKPAVSPQPNGGVKQKPTSLNLAPGPGFYRNVNGRASLNDRHLQHVTALIGGGRTAHVNKSASPNFAAAINNSELGGGGSANTVQLPALPTVPPLSAISSAWSLSAELENLLEPPPPPAPTHSSPSNRASSVSNNEHQQHQNEQQHNNLRSSPINQLPTRSPSHNGHGFPLYTPPAPIPASGANKVRSTPNGLPHPGASRRPHSIAAPPFHGVQHPLGQLAGRAAAATPLPSAAPAPGAATPTAWGSGAATPNATTCGVPGVVQRRAHSVAGTPVSLSTGNNGINGGINGQQEPRSNGPSAGGVGVGGGGSGGSGGGGVVVSATRSAVPPQSLWNGQQPLPRRPHSIASTPVTAATGLPPATTATPTNVSATARTPGEPIQWGASGMVLHQPIPRRAYASTMPHPQPPTPTSQGPCLSVLNNPGNSNTWTLGAAALRPRPHSIATTPQGAPQMPPASPSDSGYRSLPSAASDYQILKSPSKSQQNQQQQQSQQQIHQSAVRRLSLPSAQTLLRTSAPRPSPTFHGLPFRPFTCGVSPNGNPIFLGCTHLHNSNSSSGSTRTSTPATSPATPLTTSQAIQQLLAQPRNGFKIMDDKVSLFIEILDTQERFAKVSQTLLIIRAALM
ncbi:nascent polypeptide-associated complex subunit alpha, muscle-specific form-like isoform X2 [Solenopsis invicta]|uniref:nascent polypeptide-associated complex subunit alpha, muscle-specific form-like isoform X2 n=1 Tax=Solenopsis invicta TaxID=13686 RepID=UPI00193CBA7F|nr:nascent polypeptide-associated complex subunit alpha, muscle-specific form-like isoform X2 [Solenopsis invicta]